MQLCRNFTTSGVCSYGAKCRFIHDVPGSPSDLQLLESFLKLSNGSGDNRLASQKSLSTQTQLSKIALAKVRILYTVPIRLFFSKNTHKPKYKFCNPEDIAPVQKNCRGISAELDRHMALTACNYIRKTCARRMVSTWWFIIMQMALDGFPNRNMSQNYATHHEPRLSDLSMQNLYNNVQLPSTTTKLPFQGDYAIPQADLTEHVSNGDHKAWFQSVSFREGSLWLSWIFLRKKNVEFVFINTDLRLGYIFCFFTNWSYPIYIRLISEIDFRLWSHVIWHGTDF